MKKKHEILESVRIPGHLKIEGGEAGAGEIMIGEGGEGGISGIWYLFLLLLSDLCILDLQKINRLGVRLCIIFKNILIIFFYIWLFFTSRFKIKTPHISVSISHSNHIFQYSQFKLIRLK